MRRAGRAGPRGSYAVSYGRSVMQPPRARATVKTMPIREVSPREASATDRREPAEAPQGEAPQAADPASNNGAAGRPEGFDARDWLAQATGEMRESFARNRRVISFGEYFALFGAEPARQLRSAAEYVRDVFDHFGSEPVRTPRGPMTRWQLFDCPWDDGKDALVGQEEVQAAVYRLVSNFAREGRTNRLILLHGPNGSAKSTFVACLQRAMEHYSTLDEGALYRFNWIFPSQKLTKGGIGFGGGGNFESSGGQRDLRLSRGRAHRGEDRRRDARPPAAALAASEAPRADRAAPRRGDPRRASARPTTCCAAISRTATGRSSRRCSPRTTAISPRCCATCRSSASSSRAATARRRPPSSRSWRSTRARAS